MQPIVYPHGVRGWRRGHDLIAGRRPVLVLSTTEQTDNK